MACPVSAAWGPREPVRGEAAGSPRRAGEVVAPRRLAGPLPVTAPPCGPPVGRGAGRCLRRRGWREGRPRSPSTPRTRRVGLSAWTGAGVFAGRAGRSCLALAGGATCQGRPDGITLSAPGPFPLPLTVLQVARLARSRLSGCAGCSPPPKGRGLSRASCSAPAVRRPVLHPPRGRGVHAEPMGPLRPEVRVLAAHGLGASSTESPHEWACCGAGQRARPSLAGG